MDIRNIAAAFCGLVITAVLVGSAQAAEVKVLASNAVKPVLEELGPRFERESGNKVTMVFGSPAGLIAEVAKGAPFDVVVLPTSGVDDLARQGKMAAGAQTAVARSGAGVAVKRGAPKPDISTTEAFKRALLNAKSIGFVEHAPTGDYLKGLFPRLGIADQIKGKIRFFDSKVGGAGAAGTGQVEIGFAQISEILSHPAAELVGPLPADIQVYTDYLAGVGADAKQPAAAAALIKFMTTPEAGRVIKEKGMMPR
jgi:molybdate transport system substrate-binding protein